ncbi:hypothetical protein ABLG96_19175 [Nakamurella sp. A5-74]|uniref:DUF4175 domain-containing protein n=1 Tax=Nakamurella sp. A5-74 TaxID=3158264 RepID=A0AAU8DQ01_9ACTN
MDKILKVAGIVVVAWIALGLLGLIFKFLVGAVFWVGLIAGGIWLFSAVTGRSRRAMGAERHSTLR